MPNSFKLALQDDDEWLFYTDQAVRHAALSLASSRADLTRTPRQDDKDLLVAGLTIAAEL